MPRKKKSIDENKPDGRKMRKNKDVDDDVDDLIDEEDVQKKNKKDSKKGLKMKKNKKASSDDEDELSDIDLNEIDASSPLSEENNNDEMVSNKKQEHFERHPRKIINPETTIGELKTDDILTYLIQIGEETLNPQLKYGAINLLNQLTGKKKRHSPNYGSKRGNYNQHYNHNFNNRNNFNQFEQQHPYQQHQPHQHQPHQPNGQNGPNGRGRGMQPRHQIRPGRPGPIPNIQGNLYDDKNDLE